jgi:hypothetical protein
MKKINILFCLSYLFNTKNSSDLNNENNDNKFLKKKTTLFANTSTITTKIMDKPDWFKHIPIEVFEEATEEFTNKHPNIRLIIYKTSSSNPITKKNNMSKNFLEENKSLIIPITNIDKQKKLKQKQEKEKIKNNQKQMLYNYFEYKLIKKE